MMTLDISDNNAIKKYASLIQMHFKVTHTVMMEERGYCNILRRLSKNLELFLVNVREKLLTMRKNI